MKKLILSLLLTSLSAFVFGQSVTITPTGDEILVTKYGSGATPNMLGRISGGSATTPTATPANLGLLTIAGRGFITGGWVNSNNVAINLYANEAFSSTARGTFINFQTTADKTTSMVERMRINHNGNVGIGTNNPDSKLHLANTSTGVTAPANTLMTFENNTETGLTFLSGSTNTSHKSTINFGSSLGNARGQITYTPSSDELSFSTNALSRMRVEDDGRVAFGSSSFPGVKVFGDGNGSSGEIALYKDGSTNFALILTGSHGAGRGASITMRNSVNATSLLLDSDYGNSDRSRIRVDELEIVGGSDLAEYFSSSVKDKILEAGTVVSVSSSGKGDVIASSVAYDKRVVGVVSGANGIKTGLMLHQKESIADGDVAIALSGRVYVKTSGKIKAGDFLTTSDTEGFAMKAKSYRKAKGAIIGKALTDSDEKSGLVLVLLNAK